MNPKHLRWLRNINIVLLVVMIVDYLVKRFYDNVPDAEIKFPMALVIALAISALALSVSAKNKE
jgi:hypothetical protein